MSNIKDDLYRKTKINFPSKNCVYYVYLYKTHIVFNDYTLQEILSKK